MNSLANQEWIFGALIFFSGVFYISFQHWQNRKWIQKRFPGQETLVMSFGVTCFGRAGDPGGPRPRRGFLVLFSDRLFYRSQTAKSEVDIPVSEIVRVYHDRTHKGVDLGRSVIKVDFIHDQDRDNTVAFSVPYPPRWIQAVENTLIANQAANLKQNISGEG